jgi:hypothetical protein
MNFLNALIPYVPLAVCLAGCRGVWSLFKLLEREKSLVKQHLRKEVIDLIQAPASIFPIFETLPALVLSAFDGIFTDNLYSLKGFARSVMFSTVVVILLLILWYSTIPPNVHLAIEIPRARIGPPWPLPFKGDSLGNYAVISRIFYPSGLRTSANFIIPVFLAPFIYNFVTDYVALIATRRMLKTIANTRNVFLILVVFILSIPALLILADIGFALYITAIEFVAEFPLSVPQFFSPGDLVRRIAFPFYNKFPKLLGQWTAHTITGVFLASTLIGIFWVGIFSISVITANLAMKIRRLGPWLQKEMNVKQGPFKIMGGLVLIVLLPVCLILHLLFIH